MPPTTLILILALWPLSFVLGLFTGAWIWHRAKAGKSPIPELPFTRAQSKPAPPVEEVPISKQARL